MKSILTICPILSLVLVLVGVGCEPTPVQKVETTLVTPKVVAGNTEFALDLYHQLDKEPGNLFFSPYSLSIGMAMTYAGARGETAAEMAKTLHFSVPPEELHPAMAGLLNLPQGKTVYELQVANGLWVQKGYPFLPDFLTLTKKYYGAAAQEADFQHAVETARQSINGWVEKQTHGKITQPVPKEAINSKTRFMVANAIYFKGAWATKFDSKNTKDAPFFMNAKDSVVVPMMHQKETFKHLADDLLQAIELPYEGKDLSMLVLLPRKKDGLPELEKALTPVKLSRIAKEMSPAKLDVYLPRFQMMQSFSLDTTLKAMGMPLAFSAEKADFTGINAGKPENLFLGSVIHKAFVEVNEEGTTAAAATVGGGEGTARPTEFRADHPFVFMIRDRRTNSILFLGRMVDPRKTVAAQ